MEERGFETPQCLRNKYGGNGHDIRKKNLMPVSTTKQTEQTYGKKSPSDRQTPARRQGTRKGEEKKNVQCSKKRSPLRPARTRKPTVPWVREKEKRLQEITAGKGRTIKEERTAPERNERGKRPFGQAQKKKTIRTVTI